MRTIWKFQIETRMTLHLFDGWRVLHTEPQGGVPHLWVEVDTEEPRQVVHFQVVGTGHPIPYSARWLGTWQDPPFVWHLYRIHSEEDL